MNIILMGPPGSGKSTQAKLLADKLGLLRIASGDISRQIASEDTDEGKQVQDIINAGGLIPDDILFRRARKIFDSPIAANGTLMDGYPRNKEQIFLVEEMLKEKGWEVNKVIVIKLSEEEATQRMLKRAAIEGRVDDNKTVIKERFNLYHSQTDPIIDYFRGLGKVVEVDGSGTIEEVFQQISSIFENNQETKNHD